MSAALPEHRSASAETLLSWILFVLLLGLVFCLCWFDIDSDDTWWHLASGRHVWSRKIFPTTDPFSFVLQGKPWVDEYWLFQLGILALWNIGGANALTIWKTFWMMGLIAGVGVYYRKRGVPLIAFVPAALLTLCVLIPRLTERPELITWAGILCFLLALPRKTMPPTRTALILLPIIQVVWTNCHPAFVLGPALVFGTCIAQILTALFFQRTLPTADFFRRYAVLFAGVCIASLVNPYGIRLHLLPFQLTGTDVFLKTVIEWQSPTKIPLPFPRYAVLGLGIITLISSMVSVSRRDLVHAAWFVLFGGLASQAVRHSAIFAVCALVINSEVFASYASGTLTTHKLRQRAIYAVQILVLLTLIWATASSWFWALTGNYRRFGPGVNNWLHPDKTTSFIARHSPHGNGFNDYNHGGFLMWKVFPGKQVAIDGRLIVYGGELVDEFQQITNGKKSYRPFFEKHDIHYALVSNEAEVLIQRLNNDPDWHLTAADSRCLLFLDSHPANAGLVAQYKFDDEDFRRFSAVAPPRKRSWLYAGDEVYEFNRKSATLFALDRQDMALELLREGLRYHPRNARLEARLTTYLLHAGRGFMRGRQWEQAQATLEECVKLAPSGLDAWNNLGVLFARTGQHRKAREAWEECLRISPNHPAVLQNLNKLPKE